MLINRISAGFVFFISLIALLLACNAGRLKPLRVIAELNVGETQTVRLTSMKHIEVKLVEIKEVRDSLRNAIREAYVKVIVDGNEVTLSVGNYNLPVAVGKVQIDCPWIKGFVQDTSSQNRGDAMLRLWPEASPYINPLTFSYPVKQQWFANMTQTGNEPAYVDWGENPASKNIYYHYGHDIGGAEGMDEIISATNGLVIAANNEVLEGYESYPVFAHPDAVSVIDDRGWIIEYVHLFSIDPEIKPGEKISTGNRIGLLGKEGTSGGWAHLHFEIKAKDTPSGQWITEDAYPYLWEAYMKQLTTSIVAVARPHHFVWTGQEVTLNGSKSRSLGDQIASYEWIFSDSTMAYGPVQKKVYKHPGEYSEILKVTDSKGNVDYDFAVIQVSNREDPSKVFPTIQPAFYPTTGIKARMPVTFLVRTFNTDVDQEIWDFGDGTPRISVKSETVERKESTKGKFAETIHSFSKPGHYIVTVERSNENGYKATGRLHVVVGN